ncbi:hypothetical protein CerSpe_135670 [Prunus speciosa]
MAVLETECSFAKSRSSSSASSSSSDYLYGHIRFPTSYDVVFGFGSTQDVEIVFSTLIAFGLLCRWCLLQSCSCCSVVSAANLWALIMDAGTGFFSQVYELSTVFLHKDWIMEQWEKNFYISSIAGAANGSSLVVMSKGIKWNLGLNYVSQRRVQSCNQAISMDTVLKFTIKYGS